MKGACGSASRRVLYLPGSERRDDCLRGRFLRDMYGEWHFLQDEVDAVQQYGIYCAARIRKPESAEKALSDQGRPAVGHQQLFIL